VPSSDRPTYIVGVRANTRRTHPHAPWHPSLP
jgi:hypothetical protein